MDSDLSLLEITDEDDSLVQIPRNDSGVNNSTIFSCSPLHCVRSVTAHAPQTEGRVGAVGFEKLSPTPKDGINKENINGNKSEASKLNVEPQQMKRKKKGGGYNLRKSLAWDRAFFTEEGVLNPLELSMISGNHSRTNNELTIIHEEEENALVGEGDSVGASSVVQEIEENLFKQLSEDRNSTCLSTMSDALTKDTLASASLAKRKMLAVNNISRNRSKRNACPRPIASSSLKKRDTAKAQSKESKVSKIPVSKTHVPVIITNARSGASSTGFSNRNQNAHSAAYVQKSAGVKSLSKNLRSVPINAKFTAADKCSVTRTLTRRAGKDIDNSISETHPTARLQHELVTEANKGFEVHPPQRVCNTGDKRQPTQFQTTKPSGLRMPSPSLGFFSRQKASSSHSILHKSSKSCKSAESNIPKLRKVVAKCVNEARCPHTSRKSSEIVNGAAKNCTPNLSLSDVKSEPSLQVQNNQKAKVEVEVECYSLGSGEIAEQEKVETILKHVNKKSLEQVEPCKSENVLNTEDMEFHVNDKNPLLESGMDEHLGTKVDEDLFEEPQSMHYSSIQRTLTGKDNLSNIAQNAIEQEVDVQTKPLMCGAEISSESLVPRAEHDTSFKDSRNSGEFKEYNCMKIAHVNSSLGDFSDTVLGASLEGIPNKSAKGVKDGVGDFDKHGGDAQVHLLNANLSVHCNDTTRLISEAVTQQLQYFHDLDESYGEQSEILNPSIVGEINLKSDDESHVNGCLVHATILSSQKSPKRPLLEVIGASGRESKIVEMEDCQHPGDVQSGPVHKRPVDNGYDQLINSKLIQDRTKANSKLDRPCEDYITVSATAFSTEVNNFSLERSFYESNIECQHFICQMEQADCGSRRNDMPVNNGYNISDLQFRDDSSSRGTSLHCDLLIAQHDVLGNLKQQTGLLKSSKMNYMLCENESPEANHNHLLDESDSFEASANIESDTKDFTKRGAETLSGLHKHKLLAQAIREPDDGKRVIENLHVKDAQVLSSDENLVTCSCNNNPSTSVAKDQFSLVVDSINKESPLELQRPSLVADVDFPYVNLNGDLLPGNNACSEEIRSENLFEGILEQCNNYASEYIASKCHIQATSEIKDGSLNLDERAEPLQMDGANKVSAEIVKVELNHRVNDANIVSSIQGNEGQITNVVDWNCNERCSLSESLKSQVADNLISHRRIPQGSEASSLKRKSLSEEAENSTSGKDEFSNANVQNQIAGDSGEIIHLKKSGTKRKQDILTVMPPSNAAPFSEEWFAAVEAAGEEILTMKGGAVQNSPPDKPQHEPGPWSPVRRKNQVIGPYDCTKYTNMNIPDSC